MPIMASPKVQKQSLVDQIYRLIIDRIQSGDLAPGVRLKIEDLSAEFGVSRTPVREAVSRLSQDGFVVTRHNSGPAVIKFDRRQIAEIIKTNEVLFDGVMEAHAEAGAEETATLLDELDEALRRQRAALESGESDSFYAGSIRFHLALIEHCPNRTLGLLALQTQHKINMCALYYQKNPEARRASLGEHAEIAESLRSGDFRRAATLMKSHNRKALTQFLASSAESS